MPGPLARGFALGESEGGTFDDVIKLHSYFLELSRLPEFREVRAKYVNVKNPPSQHRCPGFKTVSAGIPCRIAAIAVVENK